MSPTPAAWDCRIGIGLATQVEKLGGFGGDGYMAWVPSI